jgi:hypothetical protein
VLERKNKVWNDSEKFGEKNDCSVKAIALATGAPYAKVHYKFAQHGRKEGRGTVFWQQVQVLRELGFELKLVHVGHYNDPKVKNKFKAKTVTTLERELPSRGVFLVYTSGHMLCARGGKVLDWTAGRRHQLRDIYRVVKKKPIKLY